MASMVFRLVALALLIGASSPLSGQEAFSDALLQSGEEAKSTAHLESAWLDLRQHLPANSGPQSAPRWVEAVSMNSVKTTTDGNSKSVFRIRVVQPGPDYQVLFFRLFFEDKPEARPEVIAWD